MEEIAHASGFETISIDIIRESNAKCHIFDGLVAVFVGGTDGIGKNTAKELFLRTKRPKAYIIGRFVRKPGTPPTQIGNHTDCNQTGTKRKAMPPATNFTKSTHKAKRSSSRKMSASSATSMSSARRFASSKPASTAYS